MGQYFNLDKSWFILLMLFFISPPIAIVALLGKVIYTIAKNNETEELNTFHKNTNPSRPSYETDRYTAEEHPALLTEALTVEDGKPMVGDLDLSLSDVHMDTEVTFEEEPEDHHHESEEPLKIMTCPMCDTRNPIYKIDVYETPTCEKCGMLLLDRG